MKRLTWNLWMVLVLLGCAPTYQMVARRDPESVSGRGRSTEPMTQSWEQLQLSAQPVPRAQVPSWIRRNFTVFDIRLENLASEELVVRLDQFALVDSSEVQRSPLLPEQLDRVADRYYYPPPRFVFGFGLSSGHHRRRHFGLGYHYYDGFPVYIRGDTAYLRALRDGPVVPRSQKRGWLFFERVEEYPGNRMDLYYLVDGKIRLVFPFEVIQRP